MTIEHAGNLWLASLKANYTAGSTLRKYTHLLKLIIHFFSKPGPCCTNRLESITTFDLQAFRSTRTVGPNTASKELQILKGFFGWCMDQGVIAANPVAKIKTPHVRPNEKVPYTFDEIERILEACGRVGVGLYADYAQRRCRAAILLMRHTGLRISDAILLRKDAIHEGMLRLQTKKTGAPIALPISGAVLDALGHLPIPIGSNGKRDYYFWNQTGNKDCVVADMQRVLHSVYKISGVSNAHNHRFRHTLASEILGKGGTIDHVAYILGISPMIARKHYVKWTHEFQDSVNELMGRIGSYQTGYDPKPTIFDDSKKYLDNKFNEQQTAKQDCELENY